MRNFGKRWFSLILACAVISSASCNSDQAETTPAAEDVPVGDFNFIDQTPLSTTVSNNATITVSGAQSTIDMPTFTTGSDANTPAQTDISDTNSSGSDNLTTQPAIPEVIPNYTEFENGVSFQAGQNVYFSYPSVLLQNVFDLDIYLEKYRQANAMLDESQYGSADTYKKVLSQGTCLHTQNSVMMVKGLGLTVWVKNTGGKKDGLDDITIRSFNLGKLKSASGNTLNAEYSDLGDVVSEEETEYYAKKVWKIADVADNDAITAYGVGIQDKITGAMTFVTIIRSNNYAASNIPTAEKMVEAVRFSTVVPDNITVIY